MDAALAEELVSELAGVDVMNSAGEVGNQKRKRKWKWAGASCGHLGGWTISLVQSRDRDWPRALFRQTWLVQFEVGRSMPARDLAQGDEIGKKN